MPQANPYLKLRDYLDSEAFGSLPDEARTATEQDVHELACELLANACLAAKGERLARLQAPPPPRVTLG